jgi:imidazoleglycerol phosphate dehydratase HisB
VPLDEALVDVALDLSGRHSIADAKDMLAARGVVVRPPGA